MEMSVYFTSVCSCWQILYWKKNAKYILGSTHYILHLGRPIVCHIWQGISQEPCPEIFCYNSPPTAMTHVLLSFSSSENLLFFFTIFLSWSQTPYSLSCCPTFLILTFVVSWSLFSNFYWRCWFLPWVNLIGLTTHHIICFP